MNKTILKIILASYLLVFIGGTALAQEMPPPTAKPQAFRPIAPKETLNGTLAEDDPENETKQQEQEKNREMFGPDAPGNKVDESDITHDLKFEFTARVQFALHTATTGNPKAVSLLPSEPYLQIEYKSQFNLPVALTNHRKEYDTDAQYDISTWGALARNEFFDCRLEVIIPHMPVHITTRLTPEKQSQDDIDSGEPPMAALALGFDFGGDLREDWYSFCTDTSGANLNTKGETENYQMQVLKMATPQLKAIFIEQMNPLENNEVKLSVDPTVVDDKDLANDVTLSGEGHILINPL